MSSTRPNREALESAIEAMATGPEHVALVEACRTVADRLDMMVEGTACFECGAGLFDEKVIREYRLLLAQLSEEVDDGGSVGGDLLDELRQTKI